MCGISFMCRAAGVNRLGGKKGFRMEIGDEELYL